MKLNNKEKDQINPKLKDSNLILKEFLNEIPINLQQPEFDVEKNPNGTR